MRDTGLCKITDYGATRNFYRNRLLDFRYKDINYRILSFFGQLDTNISVLDVGCGDGFFLSALRNLGFGKIRGIELSSAFVKRCLERGLDVDKMDFLVYPNDEKYDLVLLIEVLEHTGEPELFLEKAYSFLEPKGRVLLTVPVFDSVLKKYERLRTGASKLEQLKNMDEMHVQAFGKSSVKHLIRRGGKFKILASEYFCNPVHPYIARFIGEKATSVLQQITFFNQFGDWLLMILAKNG